VDADADDGVAGRVYPAGPQASARIACRAATIAPKLNDKTLHRIHNGVANKQPLQPKFPADKGTADYRIVH
jgi:hypothetical protein